MKDNPKGGSPGPAERRAVTAGRRYPGLAQLVARVVWDHQAGSSSLPSRTSSEIPTAVLFPALPKTALWWEFLRFPPRPAPLDSRWSGDGDAGWACISFFKKDLFRWPMRYPQNSRTSARFFCSKNGSRSPRCNRGSDRKSLRRYGLRQRVPESPAFRLCKEGARPWTHVPVLKNRQPI